MNLVLLRLSSTDIHWSIENAGTDPANGEPLNEINFTVGDRTYHVGRFDGDCGYTNNDPAPLPSNVVASVSCDFTESGIDISMFLEGGELITKERVYFTSEGPSSSGPYAGATSTAFQPIISVPVIDNVYRVSI